LQISTNFPKSIHTLNKNGLTKDDILYIEKTKTVFKLEPNYINFFDLYVNNYLSYPGWVISDWFYADHGRKFFGKWPSKIYSRGNIQKHNPFFFIGFNYNQQVNEQAYLLGLESIKIQAMFNVMQIYPYFTVLNKLKDEQTNIDFLKKEIFAVNKITKIAPILMFYGGDRQYWFDILKYLRLEETITYGFIILEKFNENNKFDEDEFEENLRITYKKIPRKFFKRTWLTTKIHNFYDKSYLKRLYYKYLKQKGVDKNK